MVSASNEFAKLSGYFAPMNAVNDPKMWPQENSYCQFLNNKITFEDNTLSHKIKNGNAMITTHRVMFFNEG
jgi:hypothetical protein